MMGVNRFQKKLSIWRNNPISHFLFSGCKYNPPSSAPPDQGFLHCNFPPHHLKYDESWYTNLDI